MLTLDGQAGLDIDDRVTIIIKKSDHPVSMITLPNQDYFDILNYFLSTPDIIFESVLKQQVDDLGAQILVHVIDAIDDGVKHCIFRQVNGKRYAVAFWGLLHGILHFKKMGKTILQGDDFSRLYHSSVETFIRGLSLQTVDPVGL